MRALPALLICGVAFTLAVGCKDDKAREKGEGPPVGPAGASVAQGVGPVATAFEGALTVERMQQAKAGVSPYQKWEEAWPRLLAAVGKPTRTDGDVHGWYLLVGDKCHFLEVTHDVAQDVVGTSQYGDADKLAGSYFAKCQPGGAPAEAGEAPDPAASGDGGSAGDGIGNGDKPGAGGGAATGKTGAGSGG